MKNFVRCFAFLLVSTISTVPVASFAAATYSSGGLIDSLYAAGGSNYAFRVNLVGQPNTCGLGPSFAYTNVADDNYKVFVSTLLTAYALGKPVSLVTEVVNGYCHILEVWVHN